MVSAATRSPFPHDPDAEWLDLTPGQRRSLPVSLAYSLGVHALILCVVAALVLTARAVGGSSVLWVFVGVAVLASVGTLVVPVMVGATAPQVLTHQGVLADSAGLTLVQDAKWWFAGRRLYLPWQDVWSAESIAGATRSRRVPRTPNLELRLRNGVRQVKAPYWATPVAAGSAPPNGGAADETPRLLLTLPWDDHDAFLRLVETARLSRNRRGFTPGTAQPPEPTDSGGWVPLRTTRVTRWGAYCALAVGGPLVLPVVDLMERFRGEDGLPTVITLPSVAVGVCGFLLLLALVPRFWTRQGIDLTEDHLRIVQHPMWWYRGRGANIPWRDIQNIVPGKHVVRETPTLEVFLYRVDPALRLPHWARKVHAGEALWGRVASRPRVVLDIIDPTTHEAVESVLRHARPDLFEHPPPARPESPAPAPVVAGPTGTNAHWVNVRGRWVFGWSMSLSPLVAILASIGFFLGTEMLRTRGDANAVGGALTGMATAMGVTVVIGVWLVSIMPRLFAHQGVAVGDEGITLLQEPLLWFAGRTVHVPWSQVREICLGRALTVGSVFRTRAMTPDSVVDLVLHDPDRITRAPTWVWIHPRQPRLALPWHRQPDRVRLRPGHQRAEQVVQGIRAVRPGLIRTAQGHTRTEGETSGSGRRSAAP